MFQEVDKTLCWYYNTYYKDDLDPPDAGAGNLIRFFFGVYLDEWVWDFGNVELCHLGLLTYYH